MGRLSQTTEPQTAAVIDPRLRKALLRELQVYAAVKAEMKALEADLAASATRIEELRAEAGEKTVKLEGFSVTRVTGDDRRLNRKLLIAAGVTLAQLKEGTKTSPRKPHTKITVPGEKAHAEHSDEE